MTVLERFFVLSRLQRRSTDRPIGLPRDPVRMSRVAVAENVHLVDARLHRPGIGRIARVQRRAHPPATRQQNRRRHGSSEAQYRSYHPSFSPCHVGLRYDGRSWRDGTGSRPRPAASSGRNFSRGGAEARRGFAQRRRGRRAGSPPGIGAIKYGERIRASHCEARLLLCVLCASARKITLLRASAPPVNYIDAVPQRRSSAHCPHRAIALAWSFRVGAGG